MAAELEQDIMREVGLGQHYSWFNGSGSCAYIARSAVEHLQEVLEKHSLSASQPWLKHCQAALSVDSFGGKTSQLTNTWIAVSYTIQDAMYRSECGKGLEAPGDDWNWYFWSEKERRQWQQQYRHASRWSTFPES